MRRLFPLKPVSASSNHLAPNSTTDPVHKDKEQPKQPPSGCGKDASSVWGSVVVENNGRGNLKGLKENSLGAQLRREHLSPVRPLANGEENDPMTHMCKFALHKPNRSSSLTSIFSTSSSQRNLSLFTDVSKSSTGSGDVLVQGIKSTSLAVTADGHVEDKCIKIANRSTKLPWTRRSISVPKGCSGETDTSQSPVSPQCSSLRVSRIPQKFYDFCFVVIWPLHSSLLALCNWFLGLWLLS